MKCDACNGTNFMPSEGHFFCTDCGIQSQDQQEYIFEEYQDDENPEKTFKNIVTSQEKPEKSRSNALNTTQNPKTPLSNSVNFR
jgi:uncharacterized Zn finger protein (UPF0148 family)